MPKPGDGRTVSAGGYTLKIVDLDAKGTFYSSESGPGTSTRRSGEKSPGNVSVSVSASADPPAGADAAPRQTFRANALVGLDIAGRSKEDVLLLEGVDNLRGQDERGRAVRGPDMPTTSHGQKEGLKRETLPLQTENGAKSLKTLEGDLLVISGVVRTFEFAADEVRPGVSKRVGQVSVTLESVRETDSGYEVSVTCEEPQPTMEGGRGALAELVGTDSSIYQPSATSGSSSSETRVDNNVIAEATAPKPAITRQRMGFSRLLEGTKPQRYVFRVIERQGETRRVPFKFTNIPLSGKG